MNKLLNFVVKQGAIIGVVALIAAGKSTLCSEIKKMVPEIVVKNEESKNYPYFKEYYINKDKRPRKLAPSGLSYPADIQEFSREWRRIQFTEGQKEAEKGKVVLFDMILDADPAYAMANEKDMFPHEYQNYQKRLQIAMKERRKPDLVIYLDCSPETSLKRIRKRNRDGEDALNDDEWLEYLRTMEKIYKGPWMKFMKKMGCNIEVVDWNTSPDDLKTFFKKYFSSFFKDPSNMGGQKYSSVNTCNNKIFQK